ncbi:MAG: 2-C-methyl-D-erythritol 4-phosphate cytidylyltransferase [Flavobacteriales bacterium]
MNKAIIIVAGGSGSRMKSDIPKQFMLLKGKPLILHTIEKFHQALPSCKIIVVLPSTQMTYWEELKKQYSFSIAVETAAGGKSRFESVKNGMQLISEECVVGVHDAVRPLISVENIQLLFNEAENKGNAIPFIPCKDSLREINNNENKAVAREKYVLIQTPQCFKWSLIKEGYNGEELSSFTDDASVFEHLGGKINLVQGDERNIKITYPVDFQFAELIF